MAREQRLVFGEDAELYDRSRAGYPHEMVSAVMSYGELSAGDHAVEVGAGTGKATLAFAGAGLRITALEPSTEMAAVATRNCASSPGVSVVLSSFEDWNAGGDTYDLLFAAQSWHWIDPDVRYVKAAALLRDGATLALMWHRTDWAGEPLRDELDALYSRVDPELRERSPGFPGLDPHSDDTRFLAELADTGDFEKVEDRSFRRKDTFRAEAFVNLLSTQSDHRMLASDRREKLFAEVRSLIDGHGGAVEIPHATWLVLARRNSRHGENRPSRPPR